MKNIVVWRFLPIIVIAVCPLFANGEWTTLNTGMECSIRFLVANDSMVFAATDSCGVLRSTDNGDTWIACNRWLPADRWINSMVQNEKGLIVATDSGTYRSNDYGDSWTSLDYGDSVPRVWSLSSDDSLMLSGAYPGSVYLSADRGSTWNMVDTGSFSNAAEMRYDRSTYVQSVLIYGSRLFAGFFMGGLYTAPRDGKTWTRVLVDTMSKCTPMCFATKGTSIYLGSEKGVYRSDDSGTTWKSTGLDRSIWQMSRSGDKLFALSYASADSGIVYCTEGNDDNWNKSLFNKALFKISENNRWTALATNTTSVFVGSFRGEIWRAPLTGFTPVREMAKEKTYRESMRLQVHGSGSSAMIVDFAVPAAQQTEVAVYNLSGAYVAKLYKGVATAGIHRVIWNAHASKSGRYVVVLRGAQGACAQHVLWIR